MIIIYPIFSINGKLEHLFFVHQMPKCLKNRQLLHLPDPRNNSSVIRTAEDLRCYNWAHFHYY